MKLVPRSRPSFSTFPFVFHFVPLLKVLTVVTRAFATQFCSRLRAAELQIYCPRTLGRSTTLLQLGETFMVTVCKGWSINQPFQTVVSHFHQRREIDAVYAVACTPTNTVSSTTAPKHPHPSDLLRQTPNPEEHAWPSEPRGPAPDSTHLFGCANWRFVCITLNKQAPAAV